MSSTSTVTIARTEQQHSDPNHPAQLLNRRRALIEPDLLFRSQLDLNNLLNPLRAQLHRYADVEAVDPILTLQIRGARQNLLLVLENSLNHLRRRRRWRIVSRASL